MENKEKFICEQFSLDDLKKFLNNFPDMAIEVADGLDDVKRHADNEFDRLKRESRKAMADFLSQLANMKSPTIHVEKVPVLNQEKLVEFAQKYMVQTANAVAVMRSVVDKKDIIYFTYMKDGEIIEIEKNCYVNIQSEALTRDVLELFGEENLIILK